MSYEIKGHILGFEDIREVEINKVDELFSTLLDIKNENISFTMVSPYALREYSFDLPANIKSLLEIKEDSKVSVYNIAVIQKPLEQSAINFIAPIIVNEDNKTIGQALLKRSEHPDFGMAERITSFLK
ncbi:MAG: flagellar assembly protein FliW [Campylobacterota bacterium]|nr:flagellar assembly protein FliW [Campylobacterota bacterium]